MPSQNGNGGRGNPWGSGANASPPDLDALVRQGQDRLQRMLPGGGARGIGVVVVLLLLGLGAWTAYYTVPSDSVAVVQRFGKYLKEVPPGLHFKLPLGIDTATIVPVKRQLKQEFGFTTPGATDPYQSPRDGKRETEMVTGDLNAALVEWVVQYRISDPVKFLFEVREPSETLRYVSESVMREVVGDRTVDEVITIGREEIALVGQERLQELCDQYETGIRIEQIVLQDVNPPDKVKPSFNEVNQAQQQKEKLINQAQSEYNKVIPRARGQALQAIQAAEGYKLNRVNRAKGELVARLKASLQRNVGLTRTLITLCPLLGLLGTVYGLIIAFTGLTDSSTDFGGGILFSTDLSQLRVSDRQDY